MRRLFLYNEIQRSLYLPYLVLFTVSTVFTLLFELHTHLICTYQHHYSQSFICERAVDVKHWAGSYMTELFICSS